MPLNTSGISADAERSNVYGVRRRYGKRGSVGAKAWHANKLTGVYPDGIELQGGSLVAVGGYVTTFGVVSAGIGIWFLRSIFFDLGQHEFWDYFTVVGMFCMAFAIAFVGLYFEFFGPSEAPIYFDRARRKVYYVYRSRYRRWVLFGPSRIQARVVDWDLVDCERQVTTGGSTVSIRQHEHLVFLMRRSPSDPTSGGFYVISDLEFPDALWEYIRRYMEEGAPPLAAGEAPPKARSGKPIDMFKALLERRHGYWAEWKDKPGSMVLQHLLLPFVLVWIVVNRLVVWTAQTVVWPPEVKAALGAPITEADLAGDTRHTLRAAAPGEAAAFKPPKRKRP
ncbi:DUF6708 domain-containing protein [uncultured Pseudacidovorax sp.]|uniref:DUF6708 domain-containing protein n=1 Tax=uncultured Pseudacidovorax sp. TaxID=679313 RepID=UPI0025EC15BC|nr:DUF6708 domain-containing protein [uncultured Pseudacidovorax sp.]